MNKFELKIAEQILYSRVALTEEQIKTFIKYFIMETEYTWVKNKIHLVFNMPNGRGLRIAKAIHANLLSNEYKSTKAITLFLFKMNSAFGKKAQYERIPV